MNKRIIAIFFSILFMAIIVAPSVIVALDDSIDTSIFYSITEEEENCKIKILSPYPLSSNDLQTNFDIINYQFIGYWFKKYAKPHLNLISPPPEQIIL